MALRQIADLCDQILIAKDVNSRGDFSYINAQTLWGLTFELNCGDSHFC
jgi:hypothetical protein